MNCVELEKLLSAYIDGELSPQDIKKVEVLVETNVQAKSILDDYLSVRKAIQYEAKALQYKIPAGFAASVLATIDATVKPSKAFESARYMTVSRWSNPRIFVYPLVVLVCALLIGVFYRTDTSDTTPSIAQIEQNFKQPVISAPIEETIHVPLSSGDITLSPPEISTLPEKMALKFVCRVENTASITTFFSRVFAKHEVPWTKSTSGINTVVYEISVTPDTLQKILKEFRASSIEITGNTEGLSAEEPVKVFFQVE